MKQNFSSSWVRSTQPRKQRKYRYNAPLHLRRRMLSVHLHKTLRKDHRKRSAPVRKGDEVEVMRGDFSGRRGTVSRVDTGSLKVFVDNIKRKKVSGQEVQAPLDPSNLVIVKLSEGDKKRKKMLSRAAKRV